MRKVQLIITIETDEQADKIEEILNEAEISEDQDFVINVERREIHISPHLAPTYKVGDDGEPMI